MSVYLEYTKRVCIHLRAVPTDVYFDSSTKIICPSVHVGAVDELGDMPYYAEHCAAMLAVTYSSGQGMQRNIVSDYVTIHQTSHLFTLILSVLTESIHLTHSSL